jgi:DNA/RNA endonuclease G (NUC1)
VLARDLFGTYQAIGFIMQNDTQRYYLEKCALSVDDLEKRIGMDLFPALPDDEEATAEAAFNLAFWDIDYKH